MKITIQTMLIKKVVPPVLIGKIVPLVTKEEIKRLIITTSISNVDKLPQPQFLSGYGEH